MKFACQLNDILPGTGVCALLEGRQIALFRPSAAAEVFAIDNRDPFFAANVLSPYQTLFDAIDAAAEDADETRMHELLNAVADELTFLSQEEIC